MSAPTNLGTYYEAVQFFLVQPPHSLESAVVIRFVAVDRLPRQYSNLQTEILLADLESVNSFRRGSHMNSQSHQKYTLLCRSGR
jgi:hypothetical protein